MRLVLGESLEARSGVLDDEGAPVGAHAAHVVDVARAGGLDAHLRVPRHEAAFAQVVGQSRVVELQGAGIIARPVGRVMGAELWRRMRT